MLKAVRSMCIWAGSAGLILLWVVLMAAIRATERDPLRRRTARWFRRLGKALAIVNPWHLRITGQNHVRPGETYVVVSNHQSIADIPVLSHLDLDTKWLAKAELFRMPVVGWMLRMAGDVPVARGDRARSARALLQCGRYLRQKCSVVFFPEGTRSLNGEVLPFNEGPFQLAIRENVPVLPLVVEGSGNALPRNTWIFGPARNIHLRILEPVATEGWESAALRDAVRARITSELQRLRQVPTAP
jgi:1-acyl-sn-glycerol-3-phosphate acyltransferase